ncbi:MAG: polyketide cyclase [Cytophagaceae bacterium]|nr:polyketide cyclase [Cytophagaceae bacterium]|tara:strand:- start:4496 stop:4867 length:372 start_codon:yes stop_codon:yes gene_type:complete
MTKKEIAQDFLSLCSGGDPHKAFAKYTAVQFKHHNAFFKGDAETLENAMAEASLHAPKQTIEFKHILADGDLVSVHSHVKPSPGHPGYATTHILKFDGSDKVIELWDYHMVIPKEIVNENGVF